MRIRSKLLFNTFIIIICLSAVAGIGFYYTYHVADMSLSLVELEAEPLLKISSLENSAWEMWLRLIVHSGISEVETMQQLEQEMAQLDQQIAKQIQAVANMYTLEKVEAAEHIKTLQTFQKNWQQFHEIAQQVLQLSQDFTKEDALHLIIQKGRVAYDKAIANLRNLVKQHRQNMENLRDAAIEARQNAALMIVTLTFLIGLMALILIHRFTQSFTSPLLQINHHLKSLAQGKLIEDDIKYRGNDEIAEIVLSSRQLKDGMNNTIEQANAIAAGNYDNKIALRSEQDKLGQALSEMTHTLREVTITNKTQDWFKTGQTQLHDQMSGELSLVDFAHNIVSFLTLYLEGQIGICYLVEQSTESNQNIELKQIASYAYSRRKNMGEEFQFSEGLIERAAKGQENIIITINAGLGEEMPRHLLMTPFLYENIVKGVMVLGSLKPMTEIQLEFLNQVMPSIGIAVNSVESRTKLQELLQKTKFQAEELKTQKDKLQNQTEELQHQKEELQSQSEELQTQQEELRQTNEELEARTRELEQQREDIRQQNQALVHSQQAIQAKAEELELASKYKSEFLANMSHELRTPLNSLLILAQLLADNKKGNLTDKQVEYANTIHSAGSDLLSLINEILDLSKVESGKMEVHIEEVTLAEWVENMEHKFRHVADEKGLAFHITVAKGLPPTLRTDVQRFQQIINNLLSNAFKFTREGEIKLEIKHKSSQGDIFAFSVTDTGIGIPKDKQKVIFEAFQQVDGTTSRCYGGTGLGLSISRQLARLLGGDIQLHSEEGKGCTFTLELPETFEQTNNSGVQAFNRSGVQQSETSEPFQTDDSLTPTGEKPPFFQKKGGSETAEEMADDRKTLKPEEKSILIIEDDRKFSGLLIELAREKDFKCILAEDGQTGLQLAEQYQPNAIILDVGLPQIDGWRVMERLKDNPKTRHIPVHFISASDEQSQNAKKMGAIGYLLKPVSLNELGKAFNSIEQFLAQTLKNILIIVDNEPRQHKIMELVGSENVQTTLAVTVAAALQHLKEALFDCIILDMEIEQRSGLKLLEHMQQVEGLCQTPVIVYAERELTSAEETLLLQCADSLTVKTARSPERLLDEATLFLHQIEANLPAPKRKMLRMVHDKEAILRHKKVLIVDDDMRNVFALATVLEDNEMEVIFANNGLHALTMLEKHEDVAIILMDIMMPEMDGYEAMQKIRKQVRFRKLPIIALTAKAMKGDKAKCLEAGANDYLSKPVDTEQLISLMRVWLYR
jgi:signal transduction histidine kinase/CheY-like chemotaxis protein